jgi:hypothetical protein
MKLRYEVEPYPLAGKHEGGWAVRVTRYIIKASGIEEKSFISELDFENAEDALRHGEKFVTALGHGLIPKSN